MIRHGSHPRKEIVRYAKQIEPDLLVMGAHGHGGVKDLIYYGDHLRVVMQVCGRDDFIVKLPNDGAARQLRIGDSVNVGWMADACRALQ